MASLSEIRRSIGMAYWGWRFRRIMGRYPTVMDDIKGDCDHLTVRSHSVYDGLADCTLCGKVVPVHREAERLDADGEHDDRPRRRSQAWLSRPM